MMRHQCIVTSYRRLKYLRPCLESMALDSVDLYVVDGGGDAEIAYFLLWAKTGGLVKDYHITSEENPGADVLKNIGIENYVTQPQFIISSDDLIYPPGWATMLTGNYRKLNSGPDKYTMCACSTEALIADYGHKPEHADGNVYRTVNGVRFMETGYSMVAGAVMDTEAVRRVGGFPVYGKTGCGDVAISKRLRTLGYKCGYFMSPVCDHIGRAKPIDYPEYSAAFKIDEDVWFWKAAKDEWKP